MRSAASSHSCTSCGAVSAVGELRCSACGHEWIAASEVEAARVRAFALLETLRGDPYLRSASLLAYTLRSHVRGFLDDPTHPLPRTLLEYLHTLVTEGGPVSLRQLAPHAEREWLAPQSPVLARACRYVRERFAEELAAAAQAGPAASDFERWYRELVEHA